MSHELEHELTFLAKELPEGLEGCRKKELLDIMLPTDAKHPDLRIRKQGERHLITRKYPTEDGGKRVFHEFTVPLSPEQFEELERSVKGKRLRKTRYYHEEDGHVFEISVFHDEFEGLVLVDVEFEAGEEIDDFTMPSWCLAEVTGQEWKAGGYLAGRDYEEIEPELERLGYRKLERYSPTQ